MTPAILLLLLVLALKGLVSLFPALEFAASGISWVLALILSTTVLVDVLRNAPRFLVNKRVGVLSEEQTQNWQLWYVVFMGVSIFVRALSVLLLVQWFLFPSVRFFGD